MTENDILWLKEAIKKDIDVKRYAHTISVYNECLRLSSLFELDEKDAHSLQIAALLHDITKTRSYDEQLTLAKELGISFDENELESPAVLHAMTGAAYAAREYADFADHDVVSAIACHTTGKSNMTLPEKLLFIADYIEPTREHDSCKRLRRFFYSKANNCDLVRHLDDTILMSFDQTICHLIESHRPLCQKTVSARNFILKSLDLSDNM